MSACPSSLCLMVALQATEDPPAETSNLMAAATLKHLTGYSLEDWSPDGNWSEHIFTRQNFSAQISPKDLAESYLPGFERAIKKGKAAGVMYSCSELNGIPAIDSGYLNAKLTSWGFDGYRTTDGGQIGQTVSEHHWVANTEAAPRDHP